jgi:Transmembrane amino acid transporter protein
MVFQVVVAEPFNIKPGKDCMTILFIKNPEDEKAWQHTLFTLIYMAAVVLTACLLKDMKQAIDLTGGTTNPVICFILPGLYFISCYPEDKLKKGLAWGLVVFFIIFEIFFFISLTPLGKILGLEGE